MTPGGEPRAQLAVGTAVLAFLVLAVVFVLAIWPRLSFGGGDRVEVAFAHVGALKEGAPVIVAGSAIGRIESITPVSIDGLPPGHPLAGVGGAIVGVRLEARGRRRWAANAEVFISSKGFLSSRYLELGPPPGGAAPAEPIAAGAMVRGVDPPLIDRALQRTWDNLMVSRRFLDEIGPEARAVKAALTQLAATLEAAEPTPGAFGELAAHVRATIAEARALGDELDAAGADPAALAALAARAEATLGHVRAQVDLMMAAADRLGAELARVRGLADRVAPAALARIRAVLADADRQLARAQALVANARGLLAILARGEGSLARLANDPEFPEDAKELGRILKRTPWRIIGHTGRPDTHPDP
ncbi:MAG: MCE family protein [Myxococcales bacterium]|nr:MCE family protein [Myxococcales bacterium]